MRWGCAEVSGSVENLWNARFAAEFRGFCGGGCGNLLFHVERFEGVTVIKRIKTGYEQNKQNGRGEEESLEQLVSFSEFCSFYPVFLFDHRYAFAFGCSTWNIQVRVARRRMLDWVLGIGI